MTRIGIIIEGVYDEKAFRRLIERTHTNTQVQVIARPCGGVSQLINKFPGYLKEFRYRGDVTRALVVRDGDGKCFADLDRKLRQKIAGWAPYPLQLDLFFVRKELETWFLADEKALSDLVGRQVSPQHHPETVLHAKEELKRILSRGGKDYTPAVAEILAQSGNVDVLKSRCPSFRRFWGLF
jgi:hypothetical protein